MSKAKKVHELLKKAGSHAEGFTATVARAELLKKVFEEYQAQNRFNERTLASQAEHEKTIAKVAKLSEYRNTHPDSTPQERETITKTICELLLQKA